VLGVRPDDQARLRSPETRQHLAAFANQIASAIERTELAEEAQWAQLQMEPSRCAAPAQLGVATTYGRRCNGTGRRDTLLENTIDAATRRELTETICKESSAAQSLGCALAVHDAARSRRPARPKKEWQPSRNSSARAQPHGRRLVGTTRADRPRARPARSCHWMPCLIEQSSVNLLEKRGQVHAARQPLGGFCQHAPWGRGSRRCRPRFQAFLRARRNIFDKFYRVNAARVAASGLAPICRGIVMAHGGAALRRESPGGRRAVFAFSFRLGQAPCSNRPSRRPRLNPGRNASSIVPRLIK